MEIGIVQSVNTSKGTIDVLIRGPQGEIFQPGIPIVRNSDTISIIPKVGARCMVAEVGHEMFCMGYLPEEGPEAEESNKNNDLRGGDFRIGNEKDGVVGVLEGGMLVVMASGTGLIVLRDKRELDLVGKDIAMDTPSIHKNLRTDDDGGADIDESAYSSLGRVESNKIKANDGVVEKAFDRVKSVKLQINKEASQAELVAIGKTLQDFSITVATNAGDIELSWDSTTNRLSLGAPGEVSINAGSLLRILAPTIALNSSGVDPSKALINASFICPFTQKPLGLVGVTGVVNNVQGG